MTNPAITSTTSSQETAASSIMISASVTAGTYAVDKVIATVVGPDVEGQSPAYFSEAIEMFDDDDDGTYDGVLQFVNDGEYRVVVKATDTEDNLSNDVEFVITKICQVAANTDNAHEYTPDGVCSTGSTYIGSYTNRRCGMRFQVNIPQGAVIDEAVLSVHSYSSDDPTMNIHAQAVDDAPAFAASSYNIANRTKTSAYVFWNEDNVGAFQWVDTPDISDVIQEVVDRPGWEAGNHMVIIFEPGEALYLRNYNYSDHTYGAKLKVKYHL